MKKFGAFAVKDTEDDAGDDIKVGSLFASRSHKDASPAPSPTGCSVFPNMPTRMSTHFITTCFAIIAGVCSGECFTAET